ncbi:MAG: DUF5677 domain-containing protein [Campylobacterota bacterium]|nr:DUF5677 domain-containing protein [Campylobacterota bacterium]
MDFFKYYKLIEDIEKYDKDIEIDNIKENRRDILLLGFSENIKCHYKSIISLIEQELYHSAFALIRVLFESIVRGRYFYTRFDDKKIDEFYESDDWDEFFKIGIYKMCKYLDDTLEVDHYKTIKENAYGAMCDYTHTGNLAIARCFTDSTIKPNFDDILVNKTLDDIFNLTRIFYLFLFENTFINHNILEKEEIELFYESTKIKRSTK